MWVDYDEIVRVERLKRPMSTPHLGRHVHVGGPCLFGGRTANSRDMLGGWPKGLNERAPPSLCRRGTAHSSGGEKSMLRLDDDAQRFYAELSARAEAEDYCPIEQVTGLPNCTSTTPEELDSLLRELLGLSDGRGQGLQQEEA